VILNLSGFRFFLFFGVAFLGWTIQGMAQGERKAPDPSSAQMLAMAAKGKFREAAEFADSVSKLAASQQDISKAIYYDYGACQFYFRVKQYSKALQACIRGRDRAESVERWDLASSASFGITRVYMEMGSFELAEESARHMLQTAEQAKAPRLIEPRLLYGSLLRRLERLDQARKQFELALEEADRTADPAMRANLIAPIHDQLGHLAISRKEYESAEDHFVEGYRQRLLLGKTGIVWSHAGLATLRCEQKRWEDCIRLSTLCIESMSADFPPHKSFLRRAQARMHLGQTKEAFNDLSQAARLIGSMRLNLPFGDALQTSSESDYDEIYSLLVELSARLYEETKDPSYAKAAFNASEENRAASLRNRIRADPRWRERLPDVYWNKLAELRNEEIRMLRRPTPISVSSQLRAELASMESLASPGAASASQTDLPKLQAGLLPGDLLIAFHLGDKSSWRFALSKSGLLLQTLPAKSEIARQVGEFRKVLQAGQQAHIDTGHDLFRLLFAGLPDSPGALWTIVPDETLFDIPFAALVFSKTPQPQYLVERHPLQLLPAAFADSGKPSRTRGAIVLVGDPISNRADSRFVRGNTAKQPGAEIIEFPRLAGSAVEIERCGRSWTLGPRQSLTGPDISVDALRRGLSRNPMVLHFATHVYQPPPPALRDKKVDEETTLRNQAPVITLGLKSDGWSVLTDSEITALSAPTYVVMSGCGSGKGPLAPGTGLLGLTRAWLMAGSHSVVASLWWVLDDRGEFFEDYYRALQRNVHRSASRRSAQALAIAQVKALRRNRSAEAVARWSAYFSIGVL